MRVGFIGAGKVGFSLGKYLVSNNVTVTGYFSKSSKSAKLAADFTSTKAYSSLENILEDSDTVFLTVPDDIIGEVWENIRNLDIKNKKICHCSGSIASTAFFCAENEGAFAYSIHPLCAVNDKYNSWQSLKSAVFTIEGSEKYLYQLQSLFKSFGNEVVIIDTKQKALYHAGAVMASNLVIALINMSVEVFKQCGFDENVARKAIFSLFKGNADNIVNNGLINALTGPIERNDVKTVKNHLNSLDNETWANVYKLLSLELVDLAKKKHVNRNYDELKEVLK